MIDALTPTRWTVVARQDFAAIDPVWRWKCPTADAAALQRAVERGDVIQAQRRVAPGKYELVMMLPRPRRMFAERICG